MDSTFTLVAPAAGLSAPVDQPSWFGGRFVADADQRWLQFLESVDSSRLRSFSPIFIYGPADSGKSLLASIVAQRLADRQPLAKGALLALRLKEIDRRIRHAFVIDDATSLLASWETPEILLWEDAHEASGNAAVDAFLCDLLERRAEKQRATMVCSHTAPWDSPALSSRLASRLAAGWVVRLEAPSKPLLDSVLRAFEFDSRLILEEPVRQWLLSTPRLTLPGLFRWLRLTRTAAPSATTLTKRDFLATADQAIDPPSVECSTAMRIIARELGVDLAGLVSPSRRQSLVRARGIAIVVLRDLFQLTWQEIAAWAGRKDHSTVIHAYQKTTSQLNQDRELEQELARVVRQIYKQQPLPPVPQPALSKPGKRKRSTRVRTRRSLES